MSAGIAAEPAADALDDLRIEAACLGLVLRAVLTLLPVGIPTLGLRADANPRLA